MTTQMNSLGHSQPSRPDDDDMLILVDRDDCQWGKLEKKLVHEIGALHRAFSVFIFNTQGELLLQQRADDKYHSGGLWTNTCCSHPRHGEDLYDAVNRRLAEEMGLQCHVAHAFHFTYRAELDNGLTEHELDHVFMGVSDQRPQPDANEVEQWKYMQPESALEDMRGKPGTYTAWFPLALQRILEHGLVSKVA